MQYACLCAGIEKCYIVEADATGPTKVQTDGINFTGIWAHNDIIDVNQITSNDVGGTLRMYGVEAARATLMREVRAVFGAYGIGVDPRHLGLIADFMTHMVSKCTLILPWRVTKMLPKQPQQSCSKSQSTVQWLFALSELIKHVQAHMYNASISYLVQKCEG